MNLLTEIDLWIINNAEYPFLFALAVGVLLGTWIIPDIWRLFRKHIIGRSVSTFLAEFNAIPCQDAREDFRRLLFDAFARLHPGSSPNDLANSIEGLEYPTDFPPDENTRLTDYSNRFSDRMALLADSGHFFVWNTIRSIVRNEGGGGESPPLNDDEHRKFMRGGRLSSKFWNQCGHSILEGTLRAKSIRRLLEANVFDIKALVLFEIARAHRYPVDQSSGKFGLFMLAKRLWDLRPQHPAWRRYFSNILDRQ